MSEQIERVQPNQEHQQLLDHLLNNDNAEQRGLELYLMELENKDKLSEKILADCGDRDQCAENLQLCLKQVADERAIWSKKIMADLGSRCYLVYDYMKIYGKLYPSLF